MVGSTGSKVLIKSKKSKLKNSSNLVSGRGKQALKRGAKTPSKEEPEGFLIPTAARFPAEKAVKKQQNTLHVRLICGRKTSLCPATSSFLALPIRYSDKNEAFGQIYISPKASFPSDSEDQSEGESDRRTLFIINLPRDTTSESLSKLLSEPLGIEPSSLEVRLHESVNNLRTSVTNVEKIGLIQREAQVTPIEAGGSKKHKKKEKAAQNNPNRIPQLLPKLDKIGLQTWPRKLLPTAHVRFKTTEQLNRILLLDSTSLPLRWPELQSSSDSRCWLDKYKALRETCRPSIENVKVHTDRWIMNWDKGLIPSLPLPKTEVSPQPEEVQEPRIDDDDDDQEDGGAWTVVTRGGKHGRSSTIPTQPSKKKRAPDPYAQSSMSARDETAAVKVMKRGFAKSFNQSNQEDDQNEDGDGKSFKKRRIGGDLDTSFYRTNVKETKKTRALEIKNKFLEDKAKLGLNKSKAQI